MDLQNRKKAFLKVGQLLNGLTRGNSYSEEDKKRFGKELSTLEKAIEEAHLYNGWFTAEMVSSMFRAIAQSLTVKNLDAWLKPYNACLETKKDVKTIAVVMAGNVPLVGFHDLLCVLISGNRLLSKLSSDDNKLIPVLVDLLTKIEPDFNDRVKFTSEKIENFDAVIATGSNNSSRYFDFYFGKYKNIIRRNRNGIAVIDGKESAEDLEGLANDIFLYFGLGCRNVSKIYVPKGYNFEKMLKVFESKKEIAKNHKYFNNYEYNKAIFLVNGIKHFDTGNLILTENQSLSSPLSVLYFEFYSEPETLKSKLVSISDQIQCIVTNSRLFENKVEFGKSQQPELWDYADGIDTMEFLLSLDS